jgi:hypothetical protein
MSNLLQTVIQLRQQLEKTKVENEGLKYKMNNLIS